MPAFAQVEVPATSTTTGSSTAAAPPPPAEAPAPAPTTTAAPATAPKATPVVLRIGSYGTAVKDLQRELRRRGIRITVDGAAGTIVTEDAGAGGSA